MEPAEQAAFQSRKEQPERLLRTEEVETLLAVQQAITSRLNPDDVLQMIADEARRLAGAEMGAVYLLKEDRLEVSVVSGEAKDELLGMLIPLEGSFAGEVIRTGQAVQIDDNLQIGWSVYAALVEKTGARSFVIVPLVSAGNVMGTITVASHQPGSLGSGARRLLEMLAPGAVIALENARLYEKAQQAAILEERQRFVHNLHDAVTQTLFSACLIAEVLPKLWERDPQEGQVRLEELRELTRDALLEMNSLLTTD